MSRSFFLTTLGLALCLAFSLALILSACERNAAKSTNTSYYARSALDSFPLLQDQRWAWGMGSPTLLRRGHMTPDKQEDVIVIAEPVVRRGWPWQHFFLFKGPGLSPDAISAPTLTVAPGVRGFRWGQKILRPASTRVIDLNGDGHQDIVVGYRNGRVAIYYGEGKGARWELGHVLSCERIWAFQGSRSYVGDWDGDKRLDIAILGRSGHILLWRQHRKGHFLPQPILRGLSRLPTNYGKLLQQWPRPAKSAPTRPPVRAAKPPVRVAKPQPSRVRVPLVPRSAAKRPASRPATPPRRPLVVRKLPNAGATSRKASVLARPAPKRIVRGARPRRVPRWSGLRVLYEGLPLDLNGDGALDLLVAGSDRYGHVWLWPLFNRKRGDGSMSPGRKKPLTARWPSSNPIASPRLLAMSGKAGPTLFALTSAYGYLNSRGVAMLRQFPYVRPRKPIRDPFGAGKQRILTAHSLSFGLTSGRFGLPGIALVTPSTLMVFPHLARAATARYDLRRDPLLRGRISLRGAIGCDLAGKGQDALVMLGIGAIQKRQRIGVHLLIYRKPLLKHFRTSTKSR